MGIEQVLNSLLKTKFSQNITASWVKKEKSALLCNFPEDIHPSIILALQSQGIEKLFKHQVDSWEAIKKHKNILVSTGTSSGKSLCYQLPILDQILRNNQTGALLLFPTKALTQDQYQKFNQLLFYEDKGLNKEHRFLPSIYDGDTPFSKRNAIRSSSNIILTNPDMLHLGILPHHTKWENFLSHLDFIVIDEVHIYRGVIGSHLTNVLRRLKRVLDFYGKSPVYILTSATISNAHEFAEKLVEEDVLVIDQDSSRQESRNYLFMNPPVVNPLLGLRKSLIDQTTEIAEVIIKNNLQTIFFAHSRKTVERTLLSLRSNIKDDNIQGYRSGYLKSERRKIEAGLRTGETRAVISTNALELGIDMGKVDAVVMMGYPGTIASFLQQAGRAGRKGKKSLAILIASMSPIDQYIIRNHKYVLENNPENALIDPDNPLILLNHLRCAVFELPIKNGENFGGIQWEKLKDYLDVLIIMGIIRFSHNQYFWNSDNYPAKDISLRNITGQSVILRLKDGGNEKMLGEVDFQSAYKIVHPGAVYLHNGELYLINQLDLTKNIAYLVFHDGSFYTEPVEKVDILVEETYQVIDKPMYSIHFDDLRVIQNVNGFKKYDWSSYEMLGIFDLTLPDNVFSTKGFWIGFKENFIEKIKGQNLWNNDKNDYGLQWTKIRDRIILRDNSACQNCGCVTQEFNRLHVHHRKPFRSFLSPEEANAESNLVTLCGKCHRIIEQNIRIRSGLSGFAYLFANIAPLHLMCDHSDIGYFYEPNSKNNANLPAVFIYDQYPGGIGLSAKIFNIFDQILFTANQVISQCDCQDGCPSCVGPAGENGLGGKPFTQAILNELLTV